jgi:hypothetical protein
MTPKQRAERTTRAARQTVRQSSVPVFKVVGGLRQSQNISPEPAPTRLSLTLKRGPEATRSPARTWQRIRESEPITTERR